MRKNNFPEGKRGFVDSVKKNMKMTKKIEEKVAYMSIEKCPDY
jgi:hypothetical protein